MSIQIYQNIIKKLPIELVNLIHEYVDPETTYYQTKIQEINDPRLPKIILRKYEIECFETLLRYIPLCFTLKKQRGAKKATLESKHKLENITSGHITFFHEDNIYFLQNNPIYGYISRNLLWVCFILSGFTYSMIKEGSKEIPIFDAYMVHGCHWHRPGLTWRNHLVKYLKPIELSKAEKSYLKCIISGEGIRMNPFEQLKIHAKIFACKVK